MPEPAKGERLGAFMQRFMRSAEADKDFPKRKQRVAVGLSMFRRKRAKPA